MDIDPLTQTLNRMKSHLEPKWAEPQTEKAVTVQPTSPKASDLPVSTKPQNEKAVPEDQMLRANRSRFTRALSLVCTMQRKYGSKPHELETLVEGFAWLIGGVHIDQALWALKKHAQQSHEIPTPHDLLKLIAPPPPTPSWAAYVGILQRKRAGNYLTPKQEAYIAWCEDFAITGYNTAEEREKAAHERQAIEIRLTPPPSFDCD